MLTRADLEATAFVEEAGCTPGDRDSLRRPARLRPGALSGVVWWVARAWLNGDGCRAPRFLLKNPRALCTCLSLSHTESRPKQAHTSASAGRGAAHARGQ